VKKLNMVRSYSSHGDSCGSKKPVSMNSLDKDNEEQTKEIKLFENTPQKSSLFKRRSILATASSNSTPTGSESVSADKKKSGFSFCGMDISGDIGSK